MQLTRRPFGAIDDGTPVELFTLANGAGMEADVCTYGSALVRLTAPDRNGTLADVVLGYDDLGGYLRDECYFGRLVGRVANRIGGARLVLDSEEFLLDRNDGRHHLHGGRGGFHSRVWRAEPVETGGGPGLVLTLESRDGDQGYPGNLAVTAVYTMTDDGLRLDFSAATDRTTAVNLTAHPYFNLTGRTGTDCLGHIVTIPARRYLATDPELIPTGSLAEVAGTPMDFRAGAAVGARMGEDFPPLSFAGGYDHCYVLDGQAGLKPAGSVFEPVSGRGLEVLATQPCVQFYSGNHIPEGLPGKGGAVYGERSGLCLEPQGFVDAPGHAPFPQVTLRPGQAYNQTILYRFFVK
ncbi:Aldose 1-epimerase [Pseudodesulfovibrio mercurii]|uniref:Aldose 1-epimerase n=1 Tax=Pseudodesulfovibrio mercurii TaxID=641491 RepID=F0JJP3_9BACT|nr:aldose epimerase family protein [Pseudodesulfovibrio mercurii]EGB16142.1 Aldose 1-epimerase [Pseudodesulfovibrio mercurii]